MSLVSYDYSDDESEETCTIQNSDPLESKIDHEVPAELNSQQQSSNSADSNNKIFSNSKLSSLPLNKNSKKSDQGRIQIKAFDNDFLVKQEDSESDEEKNERKRRKKSEKGSHLISMLPKPKNIKPSTVKASLTSLVPNSVNKSKTTSNIPRPSLDKDNSNNFFFMDSDDEDEKINKNLISNQSPSISSSLAPDVNTNYISGPSKPENTKQIKTSYINPNEDITYRKYIASKFDDEVNNVKFVDVDISKHISENKDWLKNITVEREHHDEELEAKTPNSTARRKNQITFLAYQAKKRELELKNQWAQNRMTKSQTRAKYGF